MTGKTALIIQDKKNDIRCEPYKQDQETKKWAGAANLYCDGVFSETLLSSQTIFKSPEASVTFMENVVQKVRSIFA